MVKRKKIDYKRISDKITKDVKEQHGLLQGLYISLLTVTILAAVKVGAIILETKFGIDKLTVSTVELVILALLLSAITYSYYDSYMGKKRKKK